MKRYPRKHFLLFLSCCLFSGTSIGITWNCMGQFIRPLSEELGAPIGAVTASITLMLLTSAFMGPFMMRLIGVIHIKLLMSLGILINSICFILFSVVQSLPALYIVSVCLGIVNVCFNMVPITILINNWFSTNVGTLLGICSSFSGIVGAILNPIVAHLILVFEYKMTFILCGVAIALTALPCAIFLVHYSPTDVGLIQFREDSNLEKNKKMVHTNELQMFPKRILGLLIIYSIFAGFISGLNPSIASIPSSLSLESSLSGLMVSFAMVGNIISKLTLGLLTDKFGAKNSVILITILGCSGLFMLSLLSQSNPIFALSACFLYGCIFTCMSNGIAYILMEVYPSSSIVRYFPILSLFSNVSYAISIAVVGTSFDIFNTYVVAEVALGIVGLVSILICFNIYKLVKNGKKQY